MPLPCVGVQCRPSSSVYEVLQLGESKVSSPANVRPVCRSVKPMGSEFTACEVGACRLTHVEDWPLVGQLSSKLTNKVCKSVWKAVTPVFQLLPMDGSPALRPWYSTEFGCWPAEVTSVVSRTPGAVKFSKPTFGPLSCGAAGMTRGVGVGVG